VLKEYAIEPEAIESWPNFKAVLGGCGIAKGRMIADFPKNNWSRMVLELFETSPENTDVQYSRAVELLSQLKRSLVRLGRNYNLENAWVANAISSDREKPFAAIILKSPLEHERVINAANLTDLDPAWQVETTTRISREANSIANCVSSLVAVSSDLILVDPNFDASKSRFRNGLRETLAMAKDTRRQFRRLELHVKYDSHDSSLDFKTDCLAELPDIVPAGWNLVVIRWERIPGGESMHRRYVLTNIGGIGIDFGLDEGRAGETTDVDILSDTVYESRLADFTEDKSPFKLFDKIIIRGTAE
jgi:hypothetical protein